MTILLLLFLATLLEYSYSIYKRDTFYSAASTFANICTQAVGVLKDVFIPTLAIFGMTVMLNEYIPHLFSIPSNIGTLVLCLIMMDFLYYIFHVANHTFLLLWTFHFVHHSDTKFNLSVGFRSSWFELVGLFATYSLLLFIGFPFTIFILVFSILSTYQFLTHNRYVHVPLFLERIFVSPRYHLVHHGVAIQNQMTNFGGMFSVWDRLFKTQSNDSTVQVFGIEGYSENNVIKIHTDPIVSYIKKLFKINVA